MTRSDCLLAEIHDPLTNSGEIDTDGFTARLGGDLRTDPANFILNATGSG